MGQYLVKTIDGIDIYVQDSGRFTAQVAGGLHTFETMPEMLALLRERATATAVIIVPYQPVSPPHRDTAVRYEPWNQRFVRVGGTACAAGGHSVVLHEDAEIFRELDDLYGDFQRLCGRWQDVLNRASHVEPADLAPKEKEKTTDAPAVEAPQPDPEARPSEG